MLDVSLARIQSASCCRCGGANASAGQQDAIAVTECIRGVLVSRGSPGLAELSSISHRSSRVRSSPMLRAKSVMAEGPPIICKSRLPAAVVADLHGRRAQVGQASSDRRNSARSSASSGSAAHLGSTTICRSSVNSPLPHHLQDPRRGVTLERRTHRERLTVEVGHRAAGLQIDGVYADLHVVPSLPNSPRTAPNAGGQMTLADLCAAAVQVSDNAAGNLLLQTIGGPSAITDFARSIGDDRTRLGPLGDRAEHRDPGRPTRHQHSTRARRRLPQPAERRRAGPAAAPAARGLDAGQRDIDRADRPA